MVANPYLTELAKALRRNSIPDFTAGASGYFSEPQPTLDPALFGTVDDLHPLVRTAILTTLFRFWKKRGYREPEKWATVWLAGSGISYQWAGDRGNGDLDTIIGVDWPAFYQNNDRWSHTGIDDVTAHLDDELRRRLWPQTAHTEFGGKTFELTYYVNQDATDIRNIHPYAAYNLTTDTWTVKPPAKTAYQAVLGSPTWNTYVKSDFDTAADLRNDIERTGMTLPPEETPYWVSAMSAVARRIETAVALITDIHGSRRNAFKPGGGGYWDYTNFRWQTAKKTGVVAVLGALERIRDEAVTATQKDLYGQTLEGRDLLVARTVRHYMGDR